MGGRLVFVRPHRLLVLCSVLVAACAALVAPVAASATTVSESDFSFAPSTVTVTEGSTVLVHNGSATPHTFTVSGHGIDVVTNGGQSSSVVVNLPPGTYSFICRFHASLGMTGTLVVRAAGGSTAGSSSASAGATPAGAPATGGGGTAHPALPLLAVGIGAALFGAGAIVVRRSRRRA